MDKTHVIIEIDSATRQTNDTIENFEVNLSTPVDLNKDRQYFMRIENIKMPTSFYNITSNYNTLLLTEDPAGSPDVIPNLIIPVGNYNESELRSTLILLLNDNTANANTYTITFDSITGKMTLGADVVQFQIQTIASGSTLNQALGFGDAQYTSADNAANDPELISVNHISLNFIRYINIKTDLGSNNHYTKSQLEAIGVQVPITEGRSTIQYYDNHNGYKARMETRHSIKHFDVRLQDQDNNPIDLNGVDWSCEIVIYEFRGI